LSVPSNRRFALWGKRDLKTALKLKKRIKRLASIFIESAASHQNALDKALERAKARGTAKPAISYCRTGSLLFRRWETAVP
jgi:hypothetical protein